MANEKDKKINGLIDIFLTVVIAFFIYTSLVFINAPLWLTLGVIALWGGLTGLKPEILRKTFKFLYR